MALNINTTSFQVTQPRGGPVAQRDRGISLPLQSRSIMFNDPRRPNIGNNAHVFGENNQIFLREGDRPMLIPPRAALTNNTWGR